MQYFSVLKEKCGDVRIVCKKKLRSSEKFEKIKSNIDPKNYPIPHTSSKNQKQEQVSQVKEKGKPKIKFSSPMESPICWLDKLILQTSLVSLVSKDIYQQAEQENLPFSKHIAIH